MGVYIFVCTYCKHKLNSSPDFNFQLCFEFCLCKWNVKILSLQKEEISRVHFLNINFLLPIFLHNIEFKNLFLNFNQLLLPDNIKVFFFNSDIIRTHEYPKHCIHKGHLNTEVTDAFLLKCSSKKISII